MAQQFCCNIDGVPLYSNLRFLPLVRKQGNMGLITQVGLCKCAITLAVEKLIAPRAVDSQAAASIPGGILPSPLPALASALRFSFPFQARAIHNAQLVSLNPHHTFRAESRPGARHHF